MTPDKTTALRGSLGIPTEAFVIVAIARLRPEKGLPTLVDALQHLADVPRDVHLVVVGAGPEGGSLARDIRKRHLGRRVHLVGHQDDVARWYALADVVAIPSYSEPFGLVAIEAAAAAKPALASSVGGLREIVVAGETGLLVRPKQPAAIAEAIRELLDAPTEGARMGANARRRYEETFTIDAMVARWIEGYDVAGNG